MAAQRCHVITGGAVNRNRLRHVALATAATLAAPLLLSLPAPAAMAAPANSPDIVERPDSTSALVAARSVGHAVETLDARTESSSTYVNPDGSRTLIATPGPTRVRRNGEWATVDLNLVDAGKGRIGAAAADADASFSADGHGVLARQSWGDTQLGLSWPSPLSAPHVEGGIASYDLPGGRTLRFVATATGFKTRLILPRRPTAPVTIDLPLDLKDASLAATPSGGFSVLDPQGNTVADIDTPAMWDATVDAAGDAARRTAVGATVVSSSTGPVLRLRPSSVWLADPTLQYPITIDPDISSVTRVRDTWVQSNVSTSQGTDAKLRTGLETGSATSRAYLQFDAASYASQLTGKHITNAGLKLYNYYSGGCSARTLNVYPVTASWTTSITWSTRPAYSTSGSYSASADFAHGNSAAGCATDAYETVDVTNMTSAWISGGLTEYGMILRADETDLSAEKRFCSMNESSDPADAPCSTAARNPTLSVTYNSYPASPSSLATNPSVLSAAGTKTYTTSLTPTLVASGTDVDGGNTRMQYEVWTDATTPTLVTSGYSSYVLQGSPGAWTVTPALSVATAYKWRARTNDGVDSSAWSAWKYVKTNTTAPTAPTIASTQYPAGQWSTRLTSGVTFTASIGSVTDLYGIKYALDNKSKEQFAAAASPSASQIAITSLTPAEGAHTLYVRTVDLAYNYSGWVAYTFGAGTGALTTPDDQARSQKFLTLGADATPAITKVTYQWRAGNAGAFSNIPVSNVTDASGTALSAWPQTRSGSTPFAPLTWDASATAGADEPVQVRPCFADSSANPCVPGSAVTAVLAAAAFDASDATTEMGPGTLALLTGDFSVHAADAELQGLSIGRDLTTLGPPAASGLSGVFGPGWRMAIDGDDTHASDVITDDTSSSGHLALTDSTGVVHSYLAPSPLPTTYPYNYTGLADAAASGDTLTRDNATQITLKTVTGAGTTWTLSSGVWKVAHLTVPGGSAETTLTLDSSGRLTRVTAPPPAGVSCTTPVRGCRVLAVTYASATTATSNAFGDYSGRVSSIGYTAWNPATSSMTTTVVSRYAYDTTGHMRQQWDPRLDYSSGSHVTTAYGYDSNGRLASLTPPAQQPWSLAYDSTGRLVTLSRYDSALGATATRRVVYSIPISGSSAPIDFTNSSTWGQSTDRPVYGVAMFPPSHPASASPTSTDWPYATLAYLDVDGRQVNAAQYGGGAWLVDSRRFSPEGLTTWSLSAGGRSEALTPTSDTDPTVAAQSDSSVRADMLATRYLFDSAGNLTDTFGPVHPVQLSTGDVVSASNHETRIYDEGAPSGGSYNLVTTVKQAAWFDDGSGAADHEVHASQTGYDAVVTGDTTGWTLRQPTSQTKVVAGGTDVTTKTRYDAKGRPTEIWSPGSTGSDARALSLVYYTADTSASISACRSKPEWAGEVCAVTPKAQPTTGSAIPSKSLTYTYWGSPDLETLTYVNGTHTTVRTLDVDYDTAARPVLSTLVTTTDGATSSANGTPIPATGFAYGAASGLPTTTSYVLNGTTYSTQESYDDWARTTGYTDADGAATTTAYNIDSLVATKSDGKGTYTFTYGGTDDLGRTERRPLVTSLAVGAGTNPSTFTASYDAGGRLVSQTYPTGLNAATRLDNAGNPTSLTYTKSGASWLSFSQSYGSDGAIVAAAGPTAAQDFTYDGAGRLSSVADTQGSTCTTRTYTFNGASDRTSTSVYPGDASGCVTTTTPTVVNTSTDQADRITSTGFTHDPLGRVTALPSWAAGGVAATITYFEDDHVNTITRGSSVQTITRDPEGRTRSIGDGTTTTTHHYASDDDDPSWMSTGSSNWTRNIYAPSGLAMVQPSSGAAQIELTDLRGNLVASFPDTTTASQTDLLYAGADEYGNPTEGAQAQWGMKGGYARETLADSGFVLMGDRVYAPALGRFLQPDPEFQGSANDYDYANQDPINQDDITGHSSNEGPSSNASSSCRCTASNRAGNRKEWSVIPGTEYFGWTSYWAEMGLINKIMSLPSKLPGVGMVSKKVKVTQYKRTKNKYAYMGRCHNGVYQTHMAWERWSQLRDRFTAFGHGFTVDRGWSVDFVWKLT